MLKLLLDPKTPFWPRLAAAGLSGVFSVSILILVVSFFADTEPVPELAVDAPEPERTVQLLPDFDAITNVEEKKQRFFDFLINYVESENARITDTRQQISTMWDLVRSGNDLSPSETRVLERIAVDYRLDVESMTPREMLQELLLRVDNVPASLALAQAASESAWGTSRFAKEGNNIFGQWCFDEGCGLIPQRRAADAEHEVRAFTSVEASVRAYFRNLNTNNAYTYFREMRQEMRERNLGLDPVVLSYGLMSYSERGHVYVNELQELIRINQLQAYDPS